MKMRARTFSAGRHEQRFTPVPGDPYVIEAKLPDTAACPRCGATYHGGHWQWQPAGSDATEVLCAACRRIEDGIPAGYLDIDNVPDGAHGEELVQLIRHHETRARTEHPLQRLIDLRQEAGRIVVTTTDVHLARGLATAVKAAFGGALRLRYSKGENVLRAHCKL